MDSLHVTDFRAKQGISILLFADNFSAVKRNKKIERGFFATRIWDKELSWSKF